MDMAKLSNKKFVGASRQISHANIVFHNGKDVKLRKHRADGTTHPTYSLIPRFWTSEYGPTQLSGWIFMACAALKAGFCFTY